MDHELMLKLSQVSVFRRIGKDHLADLSKLAIRKDYKTKQIFFHNGDLFPYMLMIDKGSVHALMVSEKGQPLIIRTLRAGDIFWGHAIIDGGPTPGNLKTAEPDTRIYLWHKDNLIPILKQNPDALWEALEVFMKRMRQAAFTIDQLAFNDVLTRLAHLIIYEYDQTGEKPIHRRSFTLEQMASMINTSPEVVCRLLNQINEEGIIDLNRNELTIKDIKKLHALANV